MHEYPSVFSFAQVAPSFAATLRAFDKRAADLREIMAGRPALFNGHFTARSMLFIVRYDDVGAPMQWRDSIPFFSVSELVSAEYSPRRFLALSRHSSMTALPWVRFHGFSRIDGKQRRPGYKRHVFPRLGCVSCSLRTTHTVLPRPGNSFKAPYSLSKTAELLQVLP